MIKNSDLYANTHNKTAQIEIGDIFNNDCQLSTSNQNLLRKFIKNQKLTEIKQHFETLIVLSPTSSRIDDFLSHHLFDQNQVHFKLKKSKVQIYQTLKTKNATTSKNIENNSTEFGQLQMTDFKKNSGANIYKTESCDLMTKGYQEYCRNFYKKEDKNSPSLNGNPSTKETDCITSGLDTKTTIKKNYHEFYQNSVNRNTKITLIENEHKKINKANESLSKHEINDNFTKDHREIRQILNIKKDAVSMKEIGMNKNSEFDSHKTDKHRFLSKDYQENGYKFYGNCDITSLCILSSEKSTKDNSCFFKDHKFMSSKKILHQNNTPACSFINCDNSTPKTIVPKITELQINNNKQKEYKLSLEKDTKPSVSTQCSGHNCNGEF